MRWCPQPPPQVWPQVLPNATGLLKSDVWSSNQPYTPQLGHGSLLERGLRHRWLTQAAPRSRKRRAGVLRMRRCATTALRTWTMSLGVDLHRPQVLAGWKKAVTLIGLCVGYPQSCWWAMAEYQVLPEPSEWGEFPASPQGLIVIVDLAWGTRNFW